jgi:hypothetical protein
MERRSLLREHKRDLAQGEMKFTERELKQHLSSVHNTGENNWCRVR